MFHIIPGIINETDANYEVMLYGYPNYSGFIACQKVGFALS